MTEKRIVPSARSIVELWGAFDLAYKMACESSQPSDWHETAMIAQQIRHEMSLSRSERTNVPDFDSLADDARAEFVPSWNNWEGAMCVTLDDYEKLKNAAPQVAQAVTPESPRPALHRDASDTEPADAAPSRSDKKRTLISQRLRAEASKWSGTACRTEEQFELKELLIDAAAALERNLLNRLEDELKQDRATNDQSDAVHTPEEFERVVDWVASHRHDENPDSRVQMYKGDWRKIVAAMRLAFSSTSLTPVAEREHGFEKWWETVGQPLLNGGTPQQAARASWIAGRTYGVDGAISASSNRYQRVFEAVMDITDSEDQLSGVRDGPERDALQAAINEARKA